MSELVAGALAGAVMATVVTWLLLDGYRLVGAAVALAFDAIGVQRIEMP